MNKVITVTTWTNCEDICLLDKSHIDKLLEVGIKLKRKKFENGSIKLYEKRLNNKTLELYTNWKIDLVLFFCDEIKNGKFSSFFKKKIIITKKSKYPNKIYTLSFDNTFYSFLKSNYEINLPTTIYLDSVFSETENMAELRKKDIDELYKKIRGGINNGNRND
jgi:hypothetical protein